LFVLVQVHHHNYIDIIFLPLVNSITRLLNELKKFICKLRLLSLVLLKFGLQHLNVYRADLRVEADVAEGNLFKILFRFQSVIPGKS
jgi:hypothetical protein